MQQHTTTYQDTLPNLVTSTDPTTAAASSLTSFSTELDDFLASLGSFPGLETPTQDIFSLPSSADSVSNTIDSSDTAAFVSEDSFSIPEDACADMQVLTNSHTFSHGGPPIAGHVGSGATFWMDSPCCCLITALGFLKDLSPKTSKGCAQAGVQISADAGSPFPTIQSVIAENERIVKALDSILQCPCSQDGYLITVVSLVVFKVLDWYAAAGRAAPTVTTADSYISHPCQIQTRSSSHFAGSLCSDGENYGENSGRVAAQMVLSELHRAQRLVNELSARFKGQGTGGARVEVGASNSTPNGTHNAIDMLCDGEGTWPFSTTMLDQLEANLRGRLRIVSLKIVDMIRQA